MIRGRLEYLRTIRSGDLSIRRMYEALERRAADVPHALGWMTSAKARRNRASIRSFRDRHAGERCVIIANGPSLNRTNLDLLDSEVTIGMNRVHLLEEKFGHRPDYAIVSDVVSQLRHIADDLAALPVPKFVNWNGRMHVRHHPDGIPEYFNLFKTTFRPRFSTDFSAGIYGGHSVTYAALQLAYYMGFREVVLVGKDHSYEASGVPTQAIESDGQELNHFAAGYYAPGQLWRVPDYKGEEFAYQMAREAFERDGRRVLDATVGGRLQVFPKVQLSAVLG